tara:strand:- start:322 stop:1338 length:1017 start_codon:yes stop_codon:yes gene_type:complete
MADLPYTYVIRRRLKTGWREYWRFRRGIVDTALPGAPGDAAFHARYQELLGQTEPKQVKAAPRMSCAWIFDRYLASPEFEQLADRTRVDYERTINKLRPFLGEERFDCLTRATIKAVRDHWRAQPRTAHKIKQLMSRLYSWADEEELVPQGFNPTAGIRKPKARVKHIPIWSEEEIEHFLANCEPFMRTPVLLALYTGQRREDLAQMEWSAFMGGIIRVRQNKTGEPLDIPCHRRLREHLESIRSNFGGPIIRAQSGRPMDANALSSAMNRAVEAIDGMPHRTLHGLRYAAAGGLNAAGASFEQIVSIIGHRTYQVAMEYIRQRRLALEAVAKLEQRA